MAFADSHPNRAKRRIRASADEVSSVGSIAAAQMQRGKYAGAEDEHDADNERFPLFCRDAEKRSKMSKHHEDKRELFHRSASGQKGRIEQFARCNRTEGLENFLDGLV